MEAWSMPLDENDLAAVKLTFELALSVTLILILLGTPIAWWLSKSASKLSSTVGALVTLPLFLPPSVLGFYMLLVLGPHGVVGWLTQTVGLGLLPFTFAGLVITSVLYSLPFVVQPIRDGFVTLGRDPIEVAYTLRAGYWDTFFNVALPSIRPSLITAAVLGFAHTVGEFGVVLMIGGNIPDKTRVVSVQIYDHVEAMEYAQAHWLSGGMVLFCFFVLLTLNRLDHKKRQAYEH